MKTLKVFAVGVLLIGLLCLGMGLLIVFTQESALQAIEYAQQAGVKEAHRFTLEQLRRAFMVAAIANIVIGSLALACGVGLFRRLELARKGWLATTVLATVIQAFWLVVQYRNGLADFESWVTLIFVVGVLAASWLYLSSSSTKSLFQVAAFAQCQSADQNERTL